MSHIVRINWDYHQGCLINGYKCKLNTSYEGCTKCPKYKKEIIIDQT